MKKAIFVMALGTLFIASCGGGEKEKTEPEKTPEQIEAQKNFDRLTEIQERLTEIQNDLDYNYDQMIKLKKISDDSDISKYEEEIEKLEKERDALDKEIESL